MSNLHNNSESVRAQAALDLYRRASACARNLRTLRAKRAPAVMVKLQLAVFRERVAELSRFLEESS